MSAILLVDDNPAVRNAVGDELREAGFTPGRADRATLVVLNTAHRCFAHPDFAAWRAAGVEAVLDGRNAWEPAQAEAAGLAYFGIGRAGRRSSSASR